MIRPIPTASRQIVVKITIKGLFIVILRKGIRCTEIKYVLSTYLVCAIAWKLSTGEGKWPDGGFAFSGL
jgi:hypothetical protein